MIKSPILIMDDNELQLWTFKKYTGGRGAPGDGLYDGGGHHRDGRDVSSTSSSWSSSSRTSACAHCIDALDLGIHEILLKPIDSTELLRVTWEALLG
jgi:hypothetical protein